MGAIAMQFLRAPLIEDEILSMARKALRADRTLVAEIIRELREYFGDSVREGDAARTEMFAVAIAATEAALAVRA